MPLDSSRSTTRTGVLYALAAYGSWGVVPVYWKLVRSVDATQMVAHRVVWALVVLVVLLAWARRLGDVGRAFRDARQLRLLFASGVLLAANWVVFLWAVNHDHVLESSLGYYVNPLVNVLLGVVFLGERLRPRQAVAVLLGVAAVTVLAVSTGAPPWIALALAITFGFYGLLRKIAKLDALIGLSVETMLLAPLALGFLVHEALFGRGMFGHGDVKLDLLVIGSGPVTAFTLLWFAHAARRLRYATLGQFQYITPTGHFLLATLLYREPLTTGHVVAFSLIAVALALYAWDSAYAARAAPPVPAE